METQSRINILMYLLSSTALIKYYNNIKAIIKLYLGTVSAYYVLNRVFKAINQVNYESTLIGWVVTVVTEFYIKYARQLKRAAYYTNFIVWKVLGVVAPNYVPYIMYVLFGLHQPLTAGYATKLAITLMFRILLDYIVSNIK